MAAALPGAEKRTTRAIQTESDAAPTPPPDDRAEAVPEEVKAARADAPGVATPPAAAENDVELIATGISGLDAQFGGGIPQGSLYLLTSNPTTATETFLAQYAAAGVIAGDTVYYFSMEHPADQVEKNVQRYLHDEETPGELRIMDGYPRQFHDVPAEARRRLGIPEGVDLIGALEHLLVDPDLEAPVRIVIESLSALLEQYPAERVFRVLRVLRAMARKLPCTAAATLVTDLHDERTNTFAKHVADGVIEFHIERKGFGIYPYIAITKLRGVAASARLLVFKETDQGLWLESTKRVF